MKINFSFRRLAKSLMWRFFTWSDMEFKLRSGITVPVADRNEMATFQEIFIQQEYDDFLDLLPLPQTVLDLGCNSGYFSILMLNRSMVKGIGQPLPKMVLIDANEKAVNRAKSVLEASDATITAVFVHGLLGMKGQKSASFFLATASAESSAINRTKRAQQIEVNCVDLQALMAENFPSGLDLIKCDIEGGEEQLIRDWGEELKQARALLIEWHGFQGTWEKFCGRLLELGFSLKMERPAGCYKNALFIRFDPLSGK